MSKVSVSTIGNLGGDPELRYLPDGQPVCNFSMCSNKKLRDGTQKTWLSISVYGNQAENCNQFLRKGSKIYIEGELKPNEQGNPHSYTKGDGTIGTTFNVTVYYVEFLDSKREFDGEDVPF